MPTDRRHDIDALRAIAFGLLILYHVGMFYVPWNWHVKSTYPAEWLQTPMLLLNQWRMPLIFLISGLALNFLLGEGQGRLGPGRVAWSRLRRLGWPLLFGMLVVVPPQAWIEARANGAFAGHYLAFLGDYLRLRPWPEGAFAGSDIGVTWMHLWYLPYLLFYTLLLCLVLALAPGFMAALRRGFCRLRGLWLLLLPVLWLMPLGLFLFPRFPYISHDLVSDWYAHAMYGSFFLFGFLLGRNAGLWGHLAAGRWWLLVLAPLSFLSLLAMNALVGDSAPRALEIAQTFVIYLNRCSWILLVLAWGHQLLNRPMGWLAYANRAVYPWYVLHQTVIVVAAYYLSGLQLGSVLEPLLLVLATVAACATIQWLVERWLPWLGGSLGLTTSISTSRRKLSGQSASSISSSPVGRS